MGNRLTEEQPAQTSQTPYGDMFDEALPHYMSMGMTYDEFWDGEYGTKRACRKAFQIRIENQRRLDDQNNWYLGQYFVMALASVPLLVNGFVPKGAHTQDYPDKPFLERQEELKKEEARKQQEEDQSKLAMAMFHAMVAQFNKNKDQPQATESGQ